MSKPLRVGHVVSHPIHYFAPLYRELSSRPEIDLTVHFYSDAPLRAAHDAEFGRAISWDAPLVGGYTHRFAASAERAPARASSAGVQMDVVREVAGARYDAVWAHGYAHGTTWLALAAARARGARLLIRDEQTLLHERRGPRGAARAFMLRRLFGQARGLYIGEANRRFMLAHGMRAERMSAARYCIDNAWHREQAQRLEGRRAELRASFGIDDEAPVVLFAGKLVDKKQPLGLIEAFARVRAERACWLLMAGDGPQRAACEEMIARHRLTNVRLAGFLNQSEMPRAYASADLLVLPSKLHETWGLVVNEAMNYELPIVVTDRVGCAPDLVGAGENGMVVRHDSTRELAGAIETLVASAGMRRAYGARSREIVSAYSIEAAADGIVAACAAAVRAPAGEERSGAWKREGSARDKAPASRSS